MRYQHYGTVFQPGVFMSRIVWWNFNHSLKVRLCQFCDEGRHSIIQITPAANTINSHWRSPDLIEVLRLPCVLSIIMETQVLAPRTNYLFTSWLKNSPNSTLLTTWLFRLSRLKIKPSGSYVKLETEHKRSLCLVYKIFYLWSVEIWNCFRSNFGNSMATEINLTYCMEK